MKPVLVSVIMGSDSDLAVMAGTVEVLEQFGIGHEVTIVSAHRTPERLVDFSKKAHKRGIKVIIAGAGGAAHLPGMVASVSPLPVIGVPMKSSISIDGWDSVLSILQMPSGVPVATVALGGAKNAGILAVEILSVADPELSRAVTEYKKKLSSEVKKKAAQLEKLGASVYLERMNAEEETS